MTETGQSRFRAAIFDRDGVLTDFNIARAASMLGELLPISIADLTRRWVNWGEQVGFPRTLEDEQTFFDNFWNYLSYSLSLPDSVRVALQGIDYTDYLTPYPDALAILPRLRSKGFKIGVLSNFSLASLQRSLNAVGFGPMVDAAISASVSQVAKPEPQSYLGIAAALMVCPEECLFFDDEPTFVDGAAAVGMTAYLVDRQGKHRASGRRVVANLAELDALLAG